MPFRVTEASITANLKERVGVANQRVALYRERVASGKRINKPSDDPGGAAAVLRLQTSAGAIERFQRGTSAAQSDLLVADGALESYTTTLDRARSLTTAGATGQLNQTAREALANELDGVRARLLVAANTQSNGKFVFGGTRQDAPPFDPTTGAAAVTPTARQTLQLEPNTNAVPIGVTADTVFSDATGTVFDELTAITTALRGTGDDVADAATIRTGISRLAGFSDLANLAASQIGSGIQTVGAATDRLGTSSLATTTQIHDIEAADFAESVVDLTSAQSALDAILQSAGTSNRRTLIDFLG